MAAFISRLKEGDGAILLTTRIVPPSDWGDCRIIGITGLDDDEGGSLFLALLPPERRVAALPNMHRKLSQRVKGHPLSIRLLAGRFSEATTDLETLLKDIDAELRSAEQATPTSLEDPERQTTLYACMDYSIRRLIPEQREVLEAISIFKAPFPLEFAGNVLNDEKQISIHLQNLVRLGLLSIDIQTFKEGKLILFELHPMLRWYIQHHLPRRDPALEQRYGKLYEQLGRQVWQFEGGYDQSAFMRYLVRQCLPDFEAALQLEHLAPIYKGSLAFYLAEPYQRLGQNRRALALYEQALEIYQELGEVLEVAVTQGAMGNVLRHLGRLQEALLVYEQSLRTKQELGEVREVAVTQSALADILVELGRPQEALALYEQALHTKQKLGEMQGAAVTQQAMGDVLIHLGRLQEALALYEQALHIRQELGIVREVAAAQSAIAYVLVQLGRQQEALALYEQSLRTNQELGEVREVATTQHAMGDMLVQMGKPKEALALYERSLRTLQELGDVKNAAVTQGAMANVLVQMDNVFRNQSMSQKLLTELRNFL